MIEIGDEAFHRHRDALEILRLPGPVIKGGRPRCTCCIAVADVNKTTVKDLLKQLKEKFGKDLSKKKALIKAVAVDYAQSQTVASEEAADTATAVEDAPPPAKKQKKDAEKAGVMKVSTRLLSCAHKG